VARVDESGMMRGPVQESVGAGSWRMALRNRIREFHICEISRNINTCHYLAINTQISEILIFEVSSDNYLPILELTSQSDILLIFYHHIILSYINQMFRKMNVIALHTETET
jgi:hypothetical protein